MNRNLKWLALISYVFMIGLNGLANALPIGGITTGEMSDRYFNLFAPAGITFSIWGLIYLLLGYHVYQLFFDREIAPSKYFMISNVFNGLWIVAWHYDQITLSLALMIGLLISLTKVVMAYKELPMRYRLPFDVYLGWITIATVANVTIWLVKAIPSGFGEYEPILTALVLLTSLAIGFFTGNWLRSIPYTLVILWSYLGILVKHISPAGFDMLYPLIIYTVVFCTMCNFVFVYRLWYYKKNSEY